MDEGRQEIQINTIPPSGTVQQTCQVRLDVQIILSIRHLNLKFGSYVDRPW